MMTTNLSMYSAVEQAILAEYFRLDLPESDDDLDLWQPAPSIPNGVFLLPGEYDMRDRNAAITNAVARIALARVQGLLPQIAFVQGDTVQFGREISSPASRSVESLPRHLFTIDWAMTAPGVSWPEAYYLTWLPGVDHWLVTSSRDTPEIGGYCDLAIGHFGADREPLAGAEQVIVGYWRGQYLDYGQERWELFFDAGLVSREEASAWADEVWPSSEPDDDDDDDA